MGGSFSESSRLYSLLDHVLDSSMVEKVSEETTRELLMLCKGQLYHYFKSPPHYKQKLLVLKILRAVDLLITKNVSGNPHLLSHKFADVSPI